ncbi:hypothetical protein MTO96_045229 [Rhipicephalus appendiculatus]
MLDRFSFLLPIGAVFGSGLGAFASQAMGRRFTLSLSALVYMLGYGTIFANSAFVTVLFGRFVTGSGHGNGVSLRAHLHRRGLLACSARIYGT